MSFKPSDHLEKFGWQKGSGIGKGEDGIKEAIKVKLKFDTAGVGHDLGEQFTYHWWEKAYNDAAQNVTAGSESDMHKKKEYVVSTKKTGKSRERKSLMYGTFVKAATLENGSESREKDLSGASDTDSEEEDKSLGSVLSDEDLFRICGGRTAHKGARHGLKANGKLARIALQDASHTGLNASEKRCHTANSLKESIQDDQVKRKKKKKSKDKERHTIADNLNDNVISNTNVLENCESCDLQEGDIVSKAKIKKKRRQSKDSEDILHNHKKAKSVSKLSTKSKKKKKKKH